MRSTPAEMPPAKSPVAEFRRDDLVDDAPRGDVGQRAFQAVADLDAQLAVVLGDHQQRAVVDLLAPDLPGLGDADRELLDRLGLRGRHDQHRDLAALARLEILQRLRSATRCRRSTACRSGRPRGRSAAAPRRRRRRPRQGASKASEISANAASIAPETPVVGEHAPHLSPLAGRGRIASRCAGEGDSREFGRGLPLTPTLSPQAGRGSALRCGNDSCLILDASHFAGSRWRRRRALKSTFGAVEISFSFSTVKFGFSL